MDKRTKIILSVLAVGITATATFLIIKRIRTKKQNKKLISESITPERIEEIKSTPLSVSNPPTTTEISAVVTTMPLDFAIKNNLEGNQFRGWVNDTYPQYAKEIDLDRTGSYNNSFMKKAWIKYGTEFVSSTDNIYTSFVNNISNSLNEYITTSPVATQILTATKTYATKPFTILDYYVNKGLGRVEVPQSAGSFKPSVAASNLYNSMKGWGTNESLFFDTMRPLTELQRNEVRNYYDNNGVGKKLGTLEMSIRGEFGGTELTEAIELIGL